MRAPPIWILALGALGATTTPPAAINTTPVAVAQPSIVPGDEWVYRISTERGAKFSEETTDEVIKRVSATTMLISVAPLGFDTTPREFLVGRDWTRFRNVNGSDTVVNHVVDFPLSVGKHWDVEYSEDNPSPSNSHEWRRLTYTVTGWETVETPAGKFQTLKIEAEGSWKATTRPRAVAAGAAQPGAADSSARTIAAQNIVGRLYQVFWFAPAVKRWVKSDEEIYNPSSIRSERVEAVLQSFKPGTAHPGD